MTKHIIGSILFSFIVGVSGFLALIFGELPQPEKTTFINIPRVESKSRCHKKNYGYYDSSKPSISVVQAVFNQRTGLLDTNLVIKREDSSIKNVTFALHFFAKDANQTRYLTSESYFLKPDFEGRNIASQSLPSRSYRWFDDLSFGENVYVIADTEKYGSSDSVPVFDESKATAVISLKGR